MAEKRCENLTKEEIQSLVNEIVSVERYPTFIRNGKMATVVFEPPSAETYKRDDWSKSKRFIWFIPCDDDSDLNDCLFIKNVSRDDALDIFRRCGVIWARFNRDYVTPRYLHKYLSPFTDARLVEEVLQRKCERRTNLFTIWRCENEPSVALVYFDCLLPDDGRKLLGEWRLHAAEERAAAWNICCVQ